jgi:hypothetical protein
MEMVRLNAATVAQTFQSAVSQVFNLPARATSQGFLGKQTRRRQESRRNGRQECPRYKRPIFARWGGLKMHLLDPPP